MPQSSQAYPVVRLAAVLLLGLVVSSPVYAQEAPEQDIRQVLEAQVSAWNRGDIPTFMTGYENAESTTFIGKTITKGYRQVLANYLERYASREKMGLLTFRDLEIQPLGSDHASVVGRWNVERPQSVGGQVGGIFTLVFRRTPVGWKIILDHTS
ncbi:MAG: nuclear transport factor 2 family protein [Gemmatimonadaceae bacterium]|nr:nuclear transport factor 2 family protein [Gloeobacterales cyanobacterium ES-bin-141]